MDYADAIRRQVEDAPRAALPAVTAALWRAFGGGYVSEAEAEALSALIEARQVSANSGENSRSPISGSRTGLPKSGDTPQGRQNGLRAGAGSRPRTNTSLERRRRWASSGRLPPAIAAKFTPGEQAALSLVAAETARRGDCRLAIEHIAAVAGISRSTVKAAIRQARQLGLLTVEERRLTGFRNDTNVVRIISPEWTAWLRLARKDGPLSNSGLSAARKGQPSRDPLGRGGITKRYPIVAKGGGVKSSTGTPTQVLKQGKTVRRRTGSEALARRGSPT